jgi:hypothetical protein
MLGRPDSSLPGGEGSKKKRNEGWSNYFIDNKGLMLETHDVYEKNELSIITQDVDENKDIYA